MLQYEDEEMGGLGGYDLVHYDDLAYVASAHQERKLTLKDTKLNGSLTFRISTFSITQSIMTFRIAPLGIMAFSINIVSMLKYRIMTLAMITLSIISLI
jgi:hypothetical protein